MCKMVNSEIIQRLAQNCDSFYLYDEKTIIEAAAALKSSFPGVRFLYSIKANPHPQVVSSIWAQGFGADAASAAEVNMARERGLEAADIQFSAPGKTAQDIADTIGCATLVADSLNEIQLIQQAAKGKNIVANIGVRVNPEFSFLGKGGAPSKFGIDEEQLFEAIPALQTLQNIHISGLHIHVKSQELNGDAIEAYYENILSLAQKVQEAVGYELSFLNMGSGIGIPYEKGDVPVDVGRLGSATAMMLGAFRAHFPNMRVYIETGRFVVGKCGFYVTKVLDKKTSPGVQYVILKNTLNGFIRPSMAQLVAKYSKEDAPAGSEPLYTTKNPCDIYALSEEKAEELVTLVGNLCTAADIAASNFVLPKLKIGDVVVFTNAGSYAAVLSPMQFSSQTPPAEFFLSADAAAAQ